MKQALRLLDERGCIVEAEGRPEVAKIAGRDLEGWPRGGGASARQTVAQRLVDNLLKGPADRRGATPL
jgi:hypothetical protein